MKLYQVTNAPAGQRWEASKADAEKLAKAYGGTVEPFNIGEAGRHELANFLNARELVAGPSPATIVGMSDEEIRQSNTPEAQAAARERMSPDPSFAQHAAKARAADEICDFILNEAKVFQVENIMAAIGTRIAELAKEHRA